MRGVAVKDETGKTGLYGKSIEIHRSDTEKRVLSHFIDDVFIHVRLFRKGANITKV